MTDNQKFKHATNHLKKSGIDNFGEIANKIGIKREEIDRIRFGGKKVSAQIIQKLTKVYPETKQFFDEAEELSEPEGHVYYSAKDIIASQKKTIAAQEAHIKLLEGNLEKAVEDLRKSLEGLKKATAFIEGTVDPEKLARLRAEFEEEWAEKQSEVK